MRGGGPAAAPRAGWQPIDSWAAAGRHTASAPAPPAAAARPCARCWPPRLGSCWRRPPAQSCLHPASAPPACPPPAAAAHLVAALFQAAEEVQLVLDHLCCNVVAHLRAALALAPLPGDSVVEEGFGAACAGREPGRAADSGGTRRRDRDLSALPATPSRRPPRPPTPVQTASTGRAGDAQAGSPSPTTTRMGVPCLLCTSPAATSPSDTGMSGSLVQWPAAASCRQRAWQQQSEQLAGLSAAATA